MLNMAPCFVPHAATHRVTAFLVRTFPPLVASSSARMVLKARRRRQGQGRNTDHQSQLCLPSVQEFQMLTYSRVDEHCVGKQMTSLISAERTKDSFDL